VVEQLAGNRELPPLLRFECDVIDQPSLMMLIRLATEVNGGSALMPIGAIVVEVEG
jgi:hypothetical protein